MISSDTSEERNGMIMALGERLNFFRRKNNMTMNYLGRLLGFEAKSADVRISQYEKDKKMPKDDLIKSMAEVLGISPRALKVPDIDSYDSLMHTLFALEDIYGLTVASDDDGIFLKLNPEVSPPGGTLWSYFKSWADRKEQLLNGEITLDDYDDWRYNFPRDDHSVIRAKVIPESLSDELLQGLANGDLVIQEKSLKRKTRKNFTRKGMPGQKDRQN